MDSPLHDSARFWLALGSAGTVIGGIVLGVGVAEATTATPAQSLWSERWFDFGFAVVILGGILLLWSVVLFLAHRHAASHLAAMRTEIVSLPGPPGPTGPTGATGATGATGPTGATEPTAEPRPIFSSRILTEGRHFFMEITNNGPGDVPDPPLLLNMLVPKSWKVQAGAGGWIPSREDLVHPASGDPVPAWLWSFKDNDPPTPGISQTYEFVLGEDLPHGAYPISLRLHGYQRFDGVFVAAADPRSGGGFLQATTP